MKYLEILNKILINIIININKFIDNIEYDNIR